MLRVVHSNRSAALAEALAPFASPRSQSSADRVLRISQAPRYDSSYPPPSSARVAHDADTVSPGKVRPDATTVSEVSPGVPRARPYQETLSATSATSQDDRSYTRRNGLLVGVAALSAGLFVWAMLGRSPPAPGGHPELGPPVKAARDLDATGSGLRKTTDSARTTLDVRSAVAPAAEQASGVDAESPPSARSAAPRPSDTARKVLKKNAHRSKPTARGSQDGSLDAGKAASSPTTFPTATAAEPDEGPLSSRK